MKMKDYQDIPKEELLLVSEKMIGLVLINAQRDSMGDPIKPYDYYKVEKHVTSGMLCIFPVGSNMRQEFINDELKQSGRLN